MAKPVIDVEQGTVRGHSQVLNSRPNLTIFWNRCLLWFDCYLLAPWFRAALPPTQWPFWSQGYVFTLFWCWLSQWRLMSAKKKCTTDLSKVTACPFIIVVNHGYFWSARRLTNNRSRHRPIDRHPCNKMRRQTLGIPLGRPFHRH